MSKQDETINRILDLEERLEHMADEKALTEEYARELTISEKTAERLVKRAKLLKARAKENELEKELYKENMAKVAEMNLQGLHHAITTLIEQVRGGYQTTKIVYFKEGTQKTVPVMVTIKEQQNALKELRIYTALFQAIFENHPSDFTAMLDNLQTAASPKAKEAPLSIAK